MEIRQQDQKMTTSPTHRLILTSVSCLGISMIMTQLVLLREFLHLFSGNELVIGIILGIWLVSTGIGAGLGCFIKHIKSPVGWLLTGQVIIALLPLIAICAVRAVKLVFIPGQLIGLTNIFSTALIIVFPYCLVAGFLLPLFTTLGSNVQSPQQIGAIYTLDTIGDIVGGLLFSFVLVFYLSPFQIITFLLVLNLLAAFFLAATYRRSFAGLIAALLVLCLSMIFFIDLEKVTGRMMYAGQQVLFQKSTPYGFLTVTHGQGQHTIFENNNVLGTTGDIMAAEEAVHFPLSQHSAPQDILLVGGALSGMLTEAQKYSPNHIDYLELDPAVLSLTKKILQMKEDARVNFIHQDARQHIRKLKNKYDAIILNTADPTTARVNRLYTVEFYKQAKSCLKSNGILSFSLSGSENYLNQEMRALVATVYRSLSTVFNNIILIPGSRHYFLASDLPLDFNIASRLTDKSISTTYVNDDYLRARLTQDRLIQVQQTVEVSAPLNTDMHPVSYFHGLQYWLTHFQKSLLMPLILIIALLLASAILILGGPQPSVNASLFSSGFVGMGLEIIILLIFQVSQGVLYQQLGLIFTAFLIGTAFGAAWSVKYSINYLRVMILLDLLLGMFALTFGIVLYLLGGELLESGESVLFICLPFLTLIIGLCVGGQLPAAAYLGFNGVDKTAGRLYSLDYLGAALGAMLTTIFLVPKYGIASSCIILGAIKTLSSIFHFLPKQFSIAPPFRTFRNQWSWMSPAICLIVFAGVGLMVGLDQTLPSIYSLSFFRPYNWFLLSFLAYGIYYAFLSRIPGPSSMRSIPDFLTRTDHTIYQQTKISLFRWIHYILFSIVVFFPIFRCYFKIPYLFCHVCPRQCLFGVLRPYLVPAALIMNLEKRFWCFQACPLGTLFDSQLQIAAKPYLNPRYLKLSSFIVVGLATYAYFKIEHDFTAQTDTLFDWYSVLFNNTFSPSLLVIVISCVIIASAFITRRFFCNYCCPVGGLSSLVQLVLSKK